MVIKDKHDISDAINRSAKSIINEKFSGGPKGTRIQIVDHDTGEVLQEVHNKIMVPGSQLVACKTFGLEAVVDLPSYNKELGLERSVYRESIQPQNEPIVCLFAVGKGGYLSSPNEVLVTATTDRIEPDELIPFRYLPLNSDLERDQRDDYFGRKVNEEDSTVTYYFKKPSTQPQLHVRYLDGTEVTNKMYEIDSSQNVEVYVEFRLDVNRLDCRDWIDKVGGWEESSCISTLSLLYAWYTNEVANPDADEAAQYTYRYYQDILPFSKVNFRDESLQDLSRALEFIYQIYY